MDGQERELDQQRALEHLLLARAAELAARGDADAHPREHSVAGLDEPAAADQRGRGIEADHVGEVGRAGRDDAEVGAVDPRRADDLAGFGLGLGLGQRLGLVVVGGLGLGLGLGGLGRVGLVGSVVDRPEVAIDRVGARRLGRLGAGCRGLGVAAEAETEAEAQHERRSDESEGLHTPPLGRKDREGHGERMNRVLGATQVWAREPGLRGPAGLLGSTASLREVRGGNQAGRSRVGWPGPLWTLACPERSRRLTSAPAGPRARRAREIGPWTRGAHWRSLAAS